MSDQKPMLEETAVSKNSRKNFKYRSSNCLNCSHPLDLSDRFCSYCSQLNSTKSLSFKDFFDEFFGSIITYDSRLRYTLRDLLFKPGTITYKFINGQRLRYANPFRFFLSVSIIFFLLNELASTLTSDKKFNFNNTEQVDDGVIQWSTGNGKDSINIKDEIVKAKAELEAKGAEASEADVWNELKKGFDQGYSQGRQAMGKDSVKTKEIEKDSVAPKAPVYITQAAIDSTSFANSLFKRLDTYWNFYDETKIKEPITALDSLGHEPSKINIWLYEKNFAVERFKKNPSDFASYFLNKVPFFLFFFAPFFAFFFWLIYSKKKYTYMEHNVFIFHIFSFVFLAALIAILPDSILGDQIVLTILLGLIGPFYFYKALRNFYKQGRLITIIKFVFLNIVFLISSTIAASLFFVITAATY